MLGGSQQGWRGRRRAVGTRAKPGKPICLNRTGKMPPEHAMCAGYTKYIRLYGQNALHKSIRETNLLTNWEADGLARFFLVSVGHFSTCY